MADPLNNIQAAYHALQDCFVTALLTQIGDAPCLKITSYQVMALSVAAEQVCSLTYIPSIYSNDTIFGSQTKHLAVFLAAEYRIFQTSLSAMVQDLDSACHQSSDPPNASPLIVSHRVSINSTGCPQVEIDPTFLSHALELRGPTSLSKIVKCSSRTVHRHTLELGIVQPGPPVSSTIMQSNGTITQIHTSLSIPVSNMTDAELNSRVSAILEIFPSFGQSMISGHLWSCGHRVPLQRIADSYVRVHGALGALDSCRSHTEYTWWSGPLLRMACTSQSRSLFQFNFKTEELVHSELCAM
jgi:hypothetical protein